MGRSESARNAQERGLPFSLAQRLFEGPTVEAVDPRDWGETRVKAIGVIDGHAFVVVYADRGSVRRLISFRDVDRKERALYWRALRAGTTDG
jgi:uncharacterized protein